MKLAAKRTDDNVRRSRDETMELQSHCRTIEEDLRLEKEWRSSLQESIVTDRTTMAELQRKLEESHEIRIVSWFMLNLVLLFFSHHKILNL